MIESLRRHVNTERPHSSLAYLTPAHSPRSSNYNRSAYNGNGRGRYACLGLRAPISCLTVPQGTSEASSRGDRLKLAVVLKNAAGQFALVPRDLTGDFVMTHPT